ncbi:MAG: DUF58 domain-containing protein [Phycisphaeraceae bacterium]|nr:DUF58 domain-containing protein [Phycisphaeraceae bacterium]
MAEFGVPTAPAPRRIDELIGGDLLAKLDQLDVTSRKIFAGKLQGERRSRRRGISVEFADYRHYTHGDDLRFIDWNVYARLDRLFLKMFQEEEDLSLVLAVDASASMHWGNPSKFDFARRLAMALGYIGLVNLNRVSAWAFGGGQVRPLPALRGRRRTRELGAWLLGLEPSGPADFTEAMRSIALKRQGRGVMVILSDFLFKEGYEKGLRYLAGGGFDTFCIQVLSPEELDPGRHGLTGDLRLTDLEDGSVTEVTVTAALLRRYRENLDAWCARLREYCVRRGMMLVTADTRTNLDTLLMEHLRRRGLLK